MNLIRTLDKDNILRDNIGPGHTQKRRELWERIVPAFNEICGLNCGLRKVQDALNRTRNHPNWPAYTVLYDD